MRQPSDIYDLTIAKGGATLDHNLDDITSGYVVGIHPGTYATFQRGPWARYGIPAAITCIRRQWPWAHIGTWFDGNTIHVDPVTIAYTLSWSLDQARWYDQKAIYHLDTGKTIYLDDALGIDQLQQDGAQ